MKASTQQIDNLVTLLDGYAEKGGHHLNVNVLDREMLLDAQNTRNSIPSSLSGYRDMRLILLS